MVFSKDSPPQSEILMTEIQKFQIKFFCEDVDQEVIIDSIWNSNIDFMKLTAFVTVIICGE